MRLCPTLPTLSGVRIRAGGGELIAESAGSGAGHDGVSLAPTSDRDRRQRLGRTPPASTTADGCKEEA